MKSQLVLRFEPDSDGAGELFVTASCERFAGAGSAWFAQDEVRAFGEKLQSGLTLTPGTEWRLEGGYWESGSSPPRLRDVLVGLRVYPIGRTGQIGIQVRLGDGTHEQQRPESRGWASFELPACYEDLHRFGAQMQRIVESSDATASLYPDEP
ncbi:hypothetical protein [Inhella gelatinilytica]|uniref:Uncharacterized protein n=1 Tax=Inhella gelatinilytica TaxID=2795030 RepID=A0A931IYD5_9BURK|nr:hypothetical protein [Inhella gelatinilytica]MBH9552278.1 hypothetical protein [Inhella gelatinilytica]